MIKCTMLIELATNTENADASLRRIGGWSESWYSEEASFSDTRFYFEGLCEKRANLLPNGALVVGQRYQTVDPVGASQTGARAFPGKADTQQDIPQMALLIRVGSTPGRNIKQFILRGLPDARVVQGEYVPSQPFTNALGSFFDKLGRFRFRGRDLSETAFPVYSVLANGTYTLEEPNAFLEGDMVRVLRTTDANGFQVGGRFRIQTAISTTSGILQGWDLGLTDGGKMRADGIVYPQVLRSAISIARVVTRRVGRPFTQYRGRRSRRR